MGELGTMTGNRQIILDRLPGGEHLSPAHFRVAESVSRASHDGETRVRVDWRIVELWKVPADELLAAGDPGLIPWVPLTRFSGKRTHICEFRSSSRDLFRSSAP